MPDDAATTLRCPSRPADVTREWLEYVLDVYTKKSKRKKEFLKEFTVSSATVPGESFNGELIAVDIGSSDNAGNAEITRKHSWIVKFLSPNVFNRAIARAVHTDEKEYLMYKEVEQELNAYQRESGDSKYEFKIAEFIYGKCNENDFVLVMENLKASGFYKSDKYSGLSYEHIKLALEDIAKIHAVSLVCKAKRDFVQRYPCYNNTMTGTSMIKDIAAIAIESVIKYLRSKPEHAHLHSKLKRKQKELLRMYSKCISKMIEEKNKWCLCHGDLWHGNLLFLNDENLSPKDITIIDWQMSGWSNPVLDLHYLFGSSTTLERRNRSLTELLQIYYDTFSAATAALNFTSIWSFEEFCQYFEDTRVFLFVFGIILCQGTLSEAGKDFYTSKATATRSTKFKAKFAKLSAWMILKPSFSFILKLGFRAMMKGIQNELVEGSNEILNRRILELVTEAEMTNLI